MQNPIPNFTQSSIISKKPDYLYEKLETLTSSKDYRVEYFWLKYCRRFLLSNVYKILFGIFVIFVRSLVINKNVKSLVSLTV